ncbi:MAG: acyltransferase [Burkholderiaceae bacterium]
MSLPSLPRKFINKVNRRLIHYWTTQSDLLQARYNDARCVYGERTKLYPSCVIENETSDPTAIVMGSDTHVRGNLQIFAHGGKIRIGDHCYVGDHTRIWSMSSIEIGDRVLISHNVNIHDHIAHSLSASDRHMHLDEIIFRGHPKTLENVTSIPVVIEDDAWVGFNATVLKGVRIGRGSIVGACAVVTKNVPDYTVVVGNPARIVGPSRP